MCTTIYKSERFLRSATTFSSKKIQIIIFKNKANHLNISNKNRSKYDTHLCDGHIEFFFLAFTENVPILQYYIRLEKLKMSNI